MLLAKRLGKKRIIAETGAGQHGVATATLCAKFGMQCDIYMGAEDVRRQELNVFRIKMLGGNVSLAVVLNAFAPLTRVTSGHSRRGRLKNAQGRRQRGDARLGHPT